MQAIYQKSGEVFGPSETIVFVEEANSHGFISGTWVLNVTPTPGWNDSLALFHGNLSSFSFEEGHANMRTWMNKATIKAGAVQAMGQYSHHWLDVMPIIRNLAGFTNAKNTKVLFSINTAGN